MVGLRSWNPLEHEADRYRLARDLGMTIDFDAHQVWLHLPNNSRATATWGPEQEATTAAYAIVLVAAKAGRLMS
jgi:hypothetical protein